MDVMRFLKKPGVAGALGVIVGALAEGVTGPVGWFLNALSMALINAMS